MMLGDLKEESVNKVFSEDEESYELIYQFTHPCKEVYQLIKKGREVFRDKVMEDTAFTYNPIDAGLLVEKIMSHIFKVNLARTQFDVMEQSPNTDDDSKKNKT